ncbi:MAG: MBL fold metallo-hydrolase [Parashewanella sp.]
MKLLISLSLAFLLTGCAAPNTVKQIITKDSVVKYKKSDPDRFQNLYVPNKLKDKTYPVTCEKNCYPQSALVECQHGSENCHYSGVNPKIDRDFGFEITWLGHASFHIRTSSGVNVLLDPVSQQFDNPVAFAHWLTGGIYRNEPKWLSKRDVENVDAVLYSHIHYDHFNKADIAAMPRNVEYFTPLNFADHFENDGYQINEMVWYSAANVQDIKIDFVPAHHFSGRIIVPLIYDDFDKSLWGGWVIEGKGKKLFFAGDTGYSKHFKDIHSKYGDMDVCLMPIASYYHKEAGNWYRYVHMTPEDALVAAQDLNCKLFVPWGYGNNSWKMGDHSTHSALLRLLYMHKKLGLTLPMHIINEGDVIKFNDI